MLIHSKLPRSAVNGPGERAVLWLQGCDLRCPACWNPSSHAFDRTRDKPVDQVGEWILSCSGVEGVTFSGGEPFQQAPELCHLCEYIKLRRPSLSIGVFSGYTLHELAHGRWYWRSPDGDAWFKGDDELFYQIRQFLDFGVFGRFCQTMACNDKPLCGSRNQEVVFFSERYSRQDLEPQGYEVSICEDGALATITGFPPADLCGQAGLPGDRTPGC
jgi:anaerobic ribonucleoside-triphosphate reductase activating protein